MRESLPTRLRVLRAEKGLTLREAARVTGLRSTTLSELERGLTHPRDVTLSRIAKGYGVPVSELISMSESEPLPKEEASPSPPETADEERRFSDSGEDKADQFLLDMFDLVRRKAQAAMADWRSRSDALTSVEAGYSAGSACYREAARIIELTAEVIQKFGDDVSPQTVKAVQLMRDALLDDLRQAAEYVHDRVVWLEQNEAEAYEAFGPEAPLYYSEHYSRAQESEPAVDELAKRRQEQRAKLKQQEGDEQQRVLKQITTEHAG